MSPTPVTYTSPTAPASYSWEATDEEVAARYGIPLRRLRAADLVAGKRGVTGHADISAAFRKSDHCDPGPDFPWTRFLRLARSSDVVERATQA